MKAAPTIGIKKEPTEKNSTKNFFSIDTNDASVLSREKLVTKLIAANKKLAYQNKEMKKLATELIIANKELTYQNEEKAKRAAELIIVNKELAYQNEEKRVQEIIKIELEAKVKERTLELASSLEREKEMNRMKSRFVTMASHEFRTPLTTILSSSSLIEQYKDREQQENRLKHINRINSSVNDLTEILNDFLSLAQVENGNIVVKNILFNLPENINEWGEEMNGMVRKKNLQINYYHNGVVKIKQSKKVLKKVLLNLLSNAIKYSPKGKEIHIISSVINNKVLITVKDHGIGIPEEEQTYLFNEFFRANNVENIQGTGLGLTIVKKYLKLLNGNISFISKLNEGTSFTIEFPNNVK